jgi:hypothetical protein
MKCSSYHNLFYDYLAGRLGPQKEREIDAHLDKCPGCKNLVSSLKNTLIILDLWETPGLTKSFTSKVMDRIRLITPYKKKYRFLRWLFPLIIILAILVFLLAKLLG